ncbi:hypothetical protein HYC85_005790 [Camellia sinensis]|uniref:Endoglucanase n=1 Tax=Camellia sinensis TaxID=4442 RepID=A0A7J7I1C3_CAMSI|nr:hypothetical protein HYC85_005790 [Camellia sinensis]
MWERSKSKGLCGWFLVLVLVACIVVAIVLTVKKKTDKHSPPQLGLVPGPLGAVNKQYGNALNLKEEQTKTLLLKGSPNELNPKSAKLSCIDFDCGYTCNFDLVAVYEESLKGRVEKKDSCNRSHLMGLKVWFGVNEINPICSFVILHWHTHTLPELQENGHGCYMWAPAKISNGHIEQNRNDYMLTSRTPMDHQIFADYVLGNNPMKMSYLVGYGDKYPQYVHHRGTSIPTDGITGCSDGWKWFNSTDPNPNVAVGALVGGPFLNETFVDSRNNSMQTEPTTYNGALIVGLLSGLVTTSSVVQSFT